jgi:oligo-1,6-glucosidase
VLELGLDQRTALAGLQAAGRDNARTPMQWNATTHAGFTTGSPWLPVNDNHRWLNAAAQLEDAGSVLAHYASLIRLRHTLPILAEGSFTPLLEHDPEIWAYTRAMPGQRLLVVANCSRATRHVELDETWLGARLILANLEGCESEMEDAPLLLGAWDARIYLAQA